jgi:hypothetical protein
MKWSMRNVFNEASDGCITRGGFLHLAVKLVWRLLNFPLRVNIEREEVS